MIPESSRSATIDLYRATRFPGGWVHEAVLVAGVVASDATLLRHGGRGWLFATVGEGGGSYSDTLHLWHADDFRGPWAPHPGNPVLIDVASARPAGPIVLRDGALIRPVQDCRGGYGSVRLLPMLRLQELRWNPKWLVGFSDLTTLHAALAHVGVESIHGTMPSSFVFEEEDLAAESLRRALFGLLRRIDVAPHPLDVAGKARGRLTGGNLTVLCAACGTPEALQTDSPTILFLEEVNEYVYRVDRMMQQLLRSGALSNVQAVVVGDFSHIAGAERFGADAYERVAAHLRPLGIPLLFGFPAGHDILNEALYMGRRAELTVDAEGGHLVFEGEAAEE